jgi:hypothetical protein
MYAACLPTRQNTLSTPWVSIEFGVDICPEILVVAADLRTTYTAATVVEMGMRLAEFDARWGRVCSIESLDMRLRRVTESRGPFPNDGASINLYYLTLRDIGKKRAMPIATALNDFPITQNREHPLTTFPAHEHGTRNPECD